MTNAVRIPIRRSIVLPSLPWLAQPKKSVDSLSEAEKASAYRKKESFANAQRDAAHAKFFLMGYRRFY